MARVSHIGLYALSCISALLCVAVPNDGAMYGARYRAPGTVGPAVASTSRWGLDGLTSPANSRAAAGIAALDREAARPPPLPANFLARLGQLAGAVPSSSPRPPSQLSPQQFASRLAGGSVQSGSASAPAYGYGIAESPSQCGTWSTSNGSTTCRAWTHGFAYYFPHGYTAFTALKNDLPITWAHFDIPYDSVLYYDTATRACAFSPAFTTSTGRAVAAQEWLTLYAELQDARTIGLTPVVVLTPGSGVPAPAVTQTGSSIPGSIPKFPVLTNATDASDYACGVEGLLGATSLTGVPVSQWEAWDEPDDACQYNNGQNPCNAKGPPCSGTSGAGMAARLYVEAVAEDRALNRTDTFAAGTYSHGSIGYFNDYFCTLQKYGTDPPVWSFHDWADVGSYPLVGGAPLAYNFDRNLYQVYAASGWPQPTVWIDEASGNITDTATTLSNGKPVPQSCHPLVSDNTGLGSCLDGSPQNEAGNAQGLLNLTSQGSYKPGQVTRVGWYEFQPPNASTGWDSGLVAPQQGAGDVWSQLAPDGVAGSNWLATGLRLSFCTLTHGIATGCSASSTAASDWSVQPRRAFGTLSPGSSVVSNVTGEQPAPGGLFWVTCFDYHTGATCGTIPPSTVAFFTSPTWRLSSSALSTIAPGTYPLTVSDWTP
jgi:hypothetical protein